LVVSQVARSFQPVIKPRVGRSWAAQHASSGCQDQAAFNPRVRTLLLARRRATTAPLRRARCAARTPLTRYERQIERCDRGRSHRSAG
jgi:hypothetical protein